MTDEEKIQRKAYYESQFKMVTEKARSEERAFSVGRNLFFHELESFVEDHLGRDLQEALEVVAIYLVAGLAGQ